MRFRALAFLILAFVSFCSGQAGEPSGIVASAFAIPDHQERLDCSHLVQRVYEDAGYFFEYAPSRELYAGHSSFQRIKQPKAGDLIVWRGHVGIVIDPVRRLFFSSLRRGYKVANYTTNYWRRRGPARFMRLRSAQRREMAAPVDNVIHRPTQ